MTVKLFYLSSNTTGGWVTYTAHLIYGLRSIGLDVELFKIRNNSESKSRPFGYSIEYRNISMEDAVVKSNHEVGVIVALQKNYRDKAAALVSAGCWMVVHDPAEFHNLKILSQFSKCITIRKAVQRQLPGSTFVPHPYQRSCKNIGTSIRSVHACSISRIDFDKNTNILLDANRILPREKKINIHGFENRLYTKFKICPSYPEWQQSKSHYPREKLAAVDICRNAKFAVDMSLIKGDGGGTQYSFLEAMDAGSVNIIHSGWIMDDDEMRSGVNCLTAHDGQGLAELLRRDDLNCRRITYGGETLLQKHDASVIATKFMESLKCR